MMFRLHGSIVPIVGTECDQVELLRLRAEKTIYLTLEMLMFKNGTSPSAVLNTGMSSSFHLIYEYSNAILELC